MIPQQEKADAYNCPQCGPIKECILDQIPSVASYFISFISIFFFGIWSLFIIPLIFQSTKVIVQRCYYCNTEITRQKFFTIPSLSDQVLQFKFGNCMVVLSRKYAIILLIIFISLFTYFEVVIAPTQKDIEEDNSNQYIGADWSTFLDLCGKYEMIDNGLRARMHFEKQFHNKIVSWDGYFVSRKRNMDFNYPHYMNWMYVKMDPTESNDDFPDIVLGIPDGQFSTLLSQTQVGQKIEFSASFINLGNDFNYHMMELVDLKLHDEIKELLSIPRYIDEDREKQFQDKNQNQYDEAESDIDIIETQDITLDNDFEEIEISAQQDPLEISDEQDHTDKDKDENDEQIDNNDESRDDEDLT